MSRSRSRHRRAERKPEQLILPPSPPAAPKAKARVIPAPEQAARVYIARRAKPSVVPGHVKLTMTLDMRRELAERLSARAIRDGVNLEAVVTELLGVDAAKGTHLRGREAQKSFIGSVSVIQNRTGVRRRDEVTGQ